MRFLAWYTKATNVTFQLSSTDLVASSTTTHSSFNSLPCPLPITESYPQLTEIPSLVFAKTRRIEPSPAEALRKKVVYAKIIRLL